MLSQSITLLNDLPNLLANLKEQSETVNHFLTDQGLHNEYNLIAGQVLTGAKNLALNMGEISLKFVGSVISWLVAALITLVLTFYMIVEGPEWNHRFWRVASFKHKRRIKKTTEEMYSAFTVYVSSQVLISSIYAVTTAIITLAIALIFGVPLMLTVPIVALTFILMFIPTFGGIICVAISGALFLLFSPLSALILFAALAICQQFLSNFVAPKIEAERSRTSALLVLIGAFFGFYLGGIFGGMVSTPIIACVAVVLRTYLANKEEQAAKKT
jgi:predicted PurR-regulated permease PerM